jgi:hypothetical protein
LGLLFYHAILGIGPSDNDEKDIIGLWRLVRQEEKFSLVCGLNSCINCHEQTVAKSSEKKI